MLEINSANHLVDTLLNAGDRLLVLDFYSPSCGGCKSLHPKVCIVKRTSLKLCFWVGLCVWYVFNVLTDLSIGWIKPKCDVSQSESRRA